MMAGRPVPEGLPYVTPWLRCPVCTASLELTGETLGCENHHCLDTARQGHPNLLLRTTPKNANTPGMFTVCDRFLSAGWYESLARRVVTALVDARRVFEVGVGAGHCIRAFLNKTPEAVGLTMDVSPTACRRIAGRGLRLGSVAIDIWRRLSVATGSLEVVFCMFTPHNPAEFIRALSPSGRPMVMTPDRDHLMELRESPDLLELDPKKLEWPDGSMTGFDLVDRQELTYPLDLSAGAVTSLVAMGPNAFHTRETPTVARITAVFVISTLQRLQTHVPNREDGPTSRNP